MKISRSIRLYKNALTLHESQGVNRFALQFTSTLRVASYLFSFRQVRIVATLDKASAEIVMTAVHRYTAAAAGFEIMAISALDDFSAVVALNRVPLYSPHIFLIHDALCTSMGCSFCMSAAGFLSKKPFRSNSCSSSKLSNPVEMASSSRTGSSTACPGVLRKPYT